MPRTHAPLPLRPRENNSRQESPGSSSNTPIEQRGNAYRAPEYDFDAEFISSNEEYEVDEGVKEIVPVNRLRGARRENAYRAPEGSETEEDELEGDRKRSDDEYFEHEETFDDEVERELECEDRQIKKQLDREEQLAAERRRERVRVAKVLKEMEDAIAQPDEEAYDDGKQEEYGIHRSPIEAAKPAEEQQRIKDILDSMETAGLVPASSRANTTAKRTSTSSVRYGPPTNVLFLGNLSINVTHQLLKEEFEEFGTVTRISIPRDFVTGHGKGFGYVEFATVDMATTALKACDGQFLSDRLLRLDYSASMPSANGSYSGRDVEDHDEIVGAELAFEEKEAVERFDGKAAALAEFCQRITDSDTSRKREISKYGDGNRSSKNEQDPNQLLQAALRHRCMCLDTADGGRDSSQCQRCPLYIRAVKAMKAQQHDESEPGSSIDGPDPDRDTLGLETHDSPIPQPEEEPIAERQEKNEMMREVGRRANIDAWRAARREREAEERNRDARPNRESRWRGVIDDAARGRKYGGPSNESSEKYGQLNKDTEKSWRLLPITNTRPVATPWSNKRDASEMRAGGLRGDTETKGEENNKEENPWDIKPELQEKRDEEFLLSGLLASLTPEKPWIDLTAISYDPDIDSKEYLYGHHTRFYQKAVVEPSTYNENRGSTTPSEVLLEGPYDHVDFEEEMSSSTSEFVVIDADGLLDLPDIKTSRSSSVTTSSPLRPSDLRQNGPTLAELDIKPYDETRILTTHFLRHTWGCEHNSIPGCWHPNDYWLSPVVVIHTQLEMWAPKRVGESFAILDITQGQDWPVGSKALPVYAEIRSGDFKYFGHYTVSNKPPEVIDMDIFKTQVPDEIKEYLGWRVWKYREAVPLFAEALQNHFAITREQMTRLKEVDAVKAFCDYGCLGLMPQWYCFNCVGYENHDASLSLSFENYWNEFKKRSFVLEKHGADALE